MTKIFLTVLFSVFSIHAYAGKCEITVTRKACPGHEKEAFKPYMGKETTKVTENADDAAACEKKGEGESKIKRKGTLMEKKVTVAFDGKAIDKTWSDKAECPTESVSKPEEKKVDSAEPKKEESKKGPQKDEKPKK